MTLMEKRAHVKIFHFGDIFKEYVAQYIMDILYNRYDSLFSDYL